jgi:hypothetical protein
MADVTIKPEKKESLMLITLHRLSNLVLLKKCNAKVKRRKTFCKRLSSNASRMHSMQQHIQDALK